MRWSPAVFVVDDEEAVRQTLVELLDSAGLTSQCFPSGEDLVERHQPDWCGVVLLDVNLPGLSGVEIVRRYCPDPIGMPVLLLTGHADVPLAVEAIRAGAQDIIEKPFKARDLLERVERGIAEDKLHYGQRLETQELKQQLAALTPRETEVMKLLTVGRANRDVAEALEISVRTAEVHRARILEKTRSDSITELVYRMVRARLID
jgi:two-component system, LuxR family, response regulator FixJ